MQEKELDRWEQFDDELRCLDGQRKQMQNNNATNIPEFLFRGQGEAKWSLETTLDRFFPKNKKVSLELYYRIILNIKPRIETFTDKQWNIASLEDYIKLLQIQSGFVTIDEFRETAYFAYLRHHGFPSPLLDWTASPYVAAFFAFNGARGDTGYVSIFAYCETTGQGKLSSSGKPYIHRLGPNVPVHRRHFFQQSQYTYCAVNETDGIYYARHEDVIAKGEENQDLLWKFILPKHERRKALAALQRMNINAFSLFGTEDSLMDTLATTEIFLKE